MHRIKLQSADGEIFQVNFDIAKVSGTIITMIEDLGIEEGDGNFIPLPTTKGRILQKIINWATYHKDDPPTEDYDGSYEKRTDDLSDWDRDFVKLDQGTLFELMLSAKYLDIKGLVELTCKAIANIIRNRTPEQIREVFNIKNDFTAAEEEWVRKENDWCKEN
ncbi:S-phase kinase-associated protein 1,SKP1 component, dimerisation,SKP1/BTB/POZ domain,SKP1 [Cinara cedri]|uniref:S-phase kinase-associated protein 1 n=1 Tax=Cinara cedri TaxID=506608 RepID=A0A5E4NC19_9HEMI|nr:S-phase kinase-associated protein 1,SKP1 component, dimerisation,SKP1/BTB/POZ domain,SKP1 [Cinara cedri]